MKEIEVYIKASKPQHLALKELPEYANKKEYFPICGSDIEGMIVEKRFANEILLCDECNKQLQMWLEMRGLKCENP